MWIIRTWKYSPLHLIPKCISLIIRLNYSKLLHYAFFYIWYINFMSCKHRKKIKCFPIPWNSWENNHVLRINSRELFRFKYTKFLRFIFFPCSSRIYSIIYVLLACVNTLRILTDKTNIRTIFFRQRVACLECCYQIYTLFALAQSVFFKKILIINVYCKHMMPFSAIR